MTGLVLTFATLTLLQNHSLGTVNEVAAPYTPTPERQQQIKNNYQQIDAGMTQEQVKAILGKPDEIDPLHTPQIKNAKRIATTYSYLLENKSAVQVYFNLNGLVVDVHHSGFDEGQPALGKHEVKYPYVASPGRQKLIREGIEEIKPGMSKSSVQAILGKPDKVHTRMSARKNKSTKTGEDHWYFLTANAEGDYLGSKGMRIVFDNLYKVVQVGKCQD